MKKAAYAIGGIILVIAIGVFASAWYFTSVLLYTGDRVCPEAHYVYCGDPSELNLAFEEVSLKTRDHLTLGSWYIPGTPGMPGVLMVHGRGATRREALRYVPSLHARGFNLLLIDLRACGTSDKTFCSMGYHERKDIQAGIDYLLGTKKLPSAGVFGYSMGASTSIMAMAEDSRIRAGVFESGFSDFRTVIKDAAKRDYGLPEYPLLPLVVFLYETRGQLSTTDPSPITSIASISPRPVMIIHGTSDQAVYHSHGEALFEAAREPKTFWSVPGGKHTQAWQADRRQAETRIPDFFTRNLKK